MRAAIGAAIIAAALSLVCSVFGSSFPGGRWYTTGFAWALGLGALGLLAVVLKGWPGGRAAKVALIAGVVALVVVALIAGNTDVLLRRRVGASANELQAFCERFAPASGLPGAGELVYAGNTTGPTVTYDIGGFEFGAPYVFRSPSGGLGCLVQVQSLGFDPSLFGLVLSPGGAPPIGKQWDSYTHLTGDWWVWKRSGAPRNAPM